MTIKNDVREMRENPNTTESIKRNAVALAWLRKVEDGPAWDRASAYVILSPDHKSYGKIKIARPLDGMGPLHVFVWDCKGTGLQYGKASGCGYDKLAAALDGLTFDGIKLQDHPLGWESQLREAGYEIIQAL